MELTSQAISLFLVATGAGGFGVFLVAWVLKKTLKNHLDNDIHAIVVVLSALAAVAQYFEQIHATLPPYILGVSLASIYGVSQVIYKVSKFSGTLANNVQKVADTTPTDALLPAAAAAAITAPAEPVATPVDPTVPEATF